MLAVTFDEIEDAFLFVSSESYGIHRALLCLDNGEIYYQSELGGLDELDEETFDCDHFVEIPHKSDLNLGLRLVYEFTEGQMPDDFSRVQQIFSSRGAYGRFKGLLEQRRMLQKWYDFEKQREEQALREWMRENDIEIKAS
ncbi:Uncharacterised protein [uncultured archaeon]|nr:Uncharacterised protein [uncultured archaeon]